MALRIMVTAGEASGDRLGAGLARALRERLHDVEIFGMGGPQMERHYEDVPRSVEYPFEEVVRQTTKGKMCRGGLYLKKYFTCSFAYMMGLALSDIPGFPGAV